MSEWGHISLTGSERYVLQLDWNPVGPQSDWNAETTYTEAMPPSSDWQVGGSEATPPFAKFTIFCKLASLHIAWILPITETALLLDLERRGHTSYTLSVVVLWPSISLNTVWILLILKIHHYTTCYNGNWPSAKIIPPLLHDEQDQTVHLARYKRVLFSSWIHPVELPWGNVNLSGKWV